MPNNKPLNFDCKVCDRCLQAMTAKQFWDHSCITGKENAIVAKKDTDERVVELEQELDEIRRDLDDNYGEQEELRSMARSLEERIHEIEEELDNIADEDE